MKTSLILRIVRVRVHGAPSPSDSLATIPSGDTTCTFQICRHARIQCSTTHQRKSPPNLTPLLPLLRTHLFFSKNKTNKQLRWNAARALAGFLQRSPELYLDRNVLELGAGGGLPGLLTAKCGARKVRTLHAEAAQLNLLSSICCNRWSLRITRTRRSSTI